MAAVRVLVAPRLASALAPLSGRHHAPSQRAALHSSAPRPGARVALVSAWPDRLPGHLPPLAHSPQTGVAQLASQGRLLQGFSLPLPLVILYRALRPRQCLSSCRCCQAAESMTEPRSTRPLRKSSKFVNTPLVMAKHDHTQWVHIVLSSSPQLAQARLKNAAWALGEGKVPGSSLRPRTYPKYNIC